MLPAVRHKSESLHCFDFRKFVEMEADLALGRSMKIPGTFREHSGNIQGTFRERSGNIQGTFREHSGNIQGTFRAHSGNIQAFREH